MQVILVGQGQALFQADLCVPAQGVESAAVHELARGAVGLAGVVGDGANIAHGLANGLGNLADGDVLSAAHVDVAEHGQGLGLVGGFRQIHHKDAGGSHVVHVQKLTLWRAAAPDGHLGRMVHLGLMEAADERGDDVAVLGVVVVARAVEVGGHDAAVVHAMTLAILAVVGLAKLDAGNLGDGVGLVGGLQCAGEQAVFGHGLGGQTGVDAARAQKQQLLDARSEGRLDEVGLHHEVVVDEVGGVAVVGVDAAYAGSSQVHLVGALLGEEGEDVGLAAQVEFGVGALDQV